MRIVSVSGACSRAGKTAVAVSLLRALPAGAGGGGEVHHHRGRVRALPARARLRGVRHRRAVPHRGGPRRPAASRARTPTGSARGGRRARSCGRSPAPARAPRPGRRCERLLAARRSSSWRARRSSSGPGAARPAGCSSPIRSLSPERWKPTSAALIAAARPRGGQPPRGPRAAVAAVARRARRASGARGKRVVADVTRPLARVGARPRAPRSPRWPARARRRAPRLEEDLPRPQPRQRRRLHVLRAGLAATSPTGGLEIAHVLKDIETLNREAREGAHEVTAISFHAYPYVADRYALMPCGGSIGDGYGPLLVAREPLDPARPRRPHGRRAGHAHHRLPGPEAVRARRRRPVVRALRRDPRRGARRAAPTSA